MLIVTRLDSESHERWLTCPVTRPNGDVAYSVRLIPVYDYERELDRGRFALFARSEQAHRIDLPYSRVHEAIGQRIGWIADNAIEPWHLDVRSDHVSHAMLQYSFARRGDAFKFRMMFGLKLGLAD